MMHIEFALVAEDRLQSFFASVRALCTADVQALSQRSHARALTRLAVEVDPDFLLAVASGRWTAVHEALAGGLRDSSRTAARQLAPFGRRKLLMTVLGDAALVVLADADPAAPLPRALRQRLAAPWVEAMGSCPGGACLAGVSTRRPASAR